MFSKIGLINPNVQSIVLQGDDSKTSVDSKTLPKMSAFHHPGQPRQPSPTLSIVEKPLFGNLPGCVQAAVQPLEHCRKSELGLQKMFTPPVRELILPEALIALENLEKNIDAYCTDSSARTKNAADTRFLSADRLQSTNQVLDWLKSQIWRDLENAPSSERVYFGYFVADQPVGLLLMDGSNIWLMATHPGAECAGSVLVEQAVQKSQKEKQSNGKVQVCPFDDASIKAYTALGFVRETGTDKTRFPFSLDPANNPNIWAKNSQGQYCLRKYMNQGYIG